MIGRIGTSRNALFMKNNNWFVVLYHLLTNRLGVGGGGGRGFFALSLEE